MCEDMQPTTTRVQKERPFRLGVASDEDFLADEGRVRMHVHHVKKASREHDLLRSTNLTQISRLKINFEECKEEEVSGVTSRVCLDLKST